MDNMKTRLDIVFLDATILTVLCVFAITAIMPNYAAADYYHYNSRYDYGRDSRGDHDRNRPTPTPRPPIVINNPAPIVINNPAPVIINNPTPTYSYNYSYNPPVTYVGQPIYVQQPVYIQQPVYVQPQPIYVQQPVYTQPTYIQQPIAYNPPAYSSGNSLDIGCYANVVSARTNQPVTWSAEVTGGAAPYTYSWTGSEGLSGSQISIVKYYSTAGNKNAIISITSADGRTGSRSCSNTVSVTNGTMARAAPPARPVVAVSQPNLPSVASAQNNNNLSASAGFSTQNIPLSWIMVLIILILFATVLYLLFNRRKI